MRFCRNCGTALAADSIPPPLEIAPTPLVNAPPARAPAPNPAAAAAPPPLEIAPTALPSSSPLSAQRRPCPHCGVPTPLGFRFCQNCGKHIPDVSSLPTTEQPPVSGVITDAPSRPVPITAPPATVTAGGAHSPAPAAPVPRFDTPIAGGSGAVGHVAARADSGPAAWGRLLSVHRDGSDGQGYALAGEWLDVGRDAEIKFDDPYLAPRHARFSRDGGAATVAPLDDLNGVFLRVIGRAPLAASSRLLLGRELLVLDILAEPERQITPLYRHGTAMFGSPFREAWGRLSQLLPNGAVRDVRYLVTEEVVIGREEGEVVFGDDEFLSRRHCRLSWDGRVCSLEDMGSSNGTFVRIIAPHRLRPGDHLRMGDQMFRFEPR